MNLIRRCKVIVHRSLVISLILGSVGHPLALSKSKAKPNPQEPIFVEEQPKFDTSFSLSPFQLGAKHIELRASQHKAILHAQDSLGLLHGGAHDFKLQAAQAGVALQAQNARMGRALQGQVDKNGRPLQGRVDKNGRPLQGTVAETPLSPLTTLERGIKSPFNFDLRKLTADIAPDIVTQMESEIGQARSRLADARLEEKKMEPALQGRTPRPDAAPISTKPKLNAGLSKAVESEINQSKKFDAEAERRAGEQLKLAMEQGEMNRVSMPKMPGGGGAQMPKLSGFPGGHSTSNVTTQRSEKEMTNELVRITKPLTSVPNIDEKLDGAKNQAQTIADSVQPGLNAILTHAHSMPVCKLPAMPNVSGQGDATDVVPWDAWHARFAAIARRPIFSSVSKAKNASGSDTVEITVMHNHSVKVRLAKGSNSAFDTAILSAYKSLDGNPSLEFPSHSRRQSITFLVDNEHKGTGAPSGVKSQPSMGDKEIVRYHF